MSNLQNYDTPASVRLDELFKEALEKASFLISEQKDTLEAPFVEAWLEKLKVIPQRGLRNQYAFELCRQLISGDIKEPFDKEPKDNLSSLKKNFYGDVNTFNELSEDFVSDFDYKQPKKKNLMTTDFDPDSSSSNRSVARSRSLRQNIHSSGQKPTFRRNKSHLDYKDYIKQLQKNNEEYKQKLLFYQNQKTISQDIPILVCQIDELVGEISGLKNKITRDQESRDILESNKNEFAEIVKADMSLKLDKLKQQLQFEQERNQNLTSDFNAIKLKLEQTTQLKDETLKLVQEWTQKYESMKQNFEQLLTSKDEELQSKDEIIEKKNTELNAKMEEIELLSVKARDLEELAGMKSSKDNKLHSIVVDQFNTVKEELCKMRSNIENSSKQQNEDHEVQMTTLKKNILRLEKFTHKLQLEYEKKIFQIMKEKDREIFCLQAQLHNKCNLSSVPYFFKRSYELDSFESKFRDVVNKVESHADIRRHDCLEKLSCIENHLKNL